VHKLSVTLLDPNSGIPDELRSRWENLRSQNPGLQSPYFAAEFTQIVAAACDNVEVAVLEQEGKSVGFFPFERLRWNFARPVGSFLSDYHGVICAPGFNFDPKQLLRLCGLAAWDYNHLPIDQTAFAPFEGLPDRSPVIDLRAGYESYVAERSRAGTQQIKKNANLERRLEREAGPLRFVAHSPDKALLENLLQWKTAQFRHNGWRDLFSLPWVRQVAERIHTTQTADFAGILSVLYAGDRLVAAHFGMRSASVLHYWFPSYDQEFSKYSPGVMLLLKMAEAAPTLGINTIDMGCGEHSYKDRLMNGFVPTARGSVELAGVVTTARRVCGLPGTVRAMVAGTPLGDVVRRIRADFR
jgi:CelD/BcsL family acetyltransferase involved in cellulose biosynthesis